MLQITDQGHYENLQCFLSPFLAVGFNKLMWNSTYVPFLVEQLKLGMQ